MHSRAHPPLAAGTRRAGVRLLLWLAPAVAISAPSVAPEIPVGGMSRPYLAIVGSPALRFAERVSSPLDAPATLPAGAPPQPNPKSEPVKPASDGSAPIDTQTHSDTTPNNTETTIIETLPGPAKLPLDKQPTGNPPVPILPDDARPKVHPEDFLPFFRFPGINHEINSTPPIPSSATYRQT